MDDQDKYTSILLELRLNSKRGQWQVIVVQFCGKRALTPLKYSPSEMPLDII
jgi:hypothetical protein